MRIRQKACAQCQQSKAVLYRCRFATNKDWLFVCGPCLQTIKQHHINTYQYGGTWKARKR
ncbi:hypothetical protein [Pseudoalteromonas piratica]|uniref:hypothetical protein n=1 Tax=Pseudoalteromonas piratica TaxID=1348114 RepID=UPI0009DDFB85|nr:hypothetical protein [Pseudoalteromonas piratica]